MEIARLHRKLGATMLYVTHDQVEAMTLGQRIVVLNEGVVQQIDTPMALYERPANQFVATFLGSPAMNVLAGRLVREGGLALDLGDGHSLPLGDVAVEDGWIGREVSVGIRPEHLIPGAGHQAFDAQVELVEPVGAEVFANLRLGKHPLVARFGPDLRPEPGQALPLRVSSRHVHVFDTATGARLSAGQ